MDDVGGKSLIKIFPSLNLANSKIVSNDKPKLSLSQVRENNNT
jgi:hypothetical protein